MVKSCPECGGRDLETDYTLGQIACQSCGMIVERGILVSEVGFTEGGGGRMHVQGAFVGHHATGISGMRGKDSGQSSAAVKQAGLEKIRQTAQAMGLGTGIIGGATRSFSLAVDQRFNKGRRTDYLVASCLYLQCRLMKEPYMLIDFSERLQVNVFELAGVYLKLRTDLHLDKSMPEVDPAIYNIHFARRLQFGTDAQGVAADASRLVRRFKADWMTQGRRPAGICGACLIIAARMSNYLRTPEEVGQVVKVSAYTIRKRLREFAVTEMAQKTVKEWRGLSEKELDEIREEEPPIVRYNRLKKERLEREAKEEGEEQDEGDEDEDEEEDRPKKRDKGKKRQRSDEPMDADEAIRDVAAGVTSGDEEEGDEEEDEDQDLGILTGPALADDIDASGDNPEANQQARKQERSAFKRQNRALTKALLQPDIEDDDALSELGDVDKEEGNEQPDPTQLDNYITEDGVNLFKPDTFTEWDSAESTLQHFTQSYFASDPRLAILDPGHVKDRIAKWLNTGRDPKDVAWECQVVDAAYRRREFLARESRLETLSDLDDEELETYYVLDEGDKQLRARVWLSQNGKWLEQSKIKEEERTAYNKANNIDPNKPKAKRKRGGGTGPQKPFKSTRDAVEAFAAQKKFSSRINYGALGKLGGGSKFDPSDMGGLERMDDEKDDDQDYTAALNGDFPIDPDDAPDKEDEEEDDDAYW